MNWQTFFSVFVSVFLAEIGDKTQLATVLFSSKGDTSKWLVFSAAASALVLTSAIGVLAGSQLGRFISEQTIKWVAGCGFIIIGIWTIIAK